MFLDSMKVVVIAVNKCVKGALSWGNMLTAQILNAKCSLTPLYFIEWHRTSMLVTFTEHIDLCRTFLQDVNAQEREPLQNMGRLSLFKAFVAQYVHRTRTMTHFICNTLTLFGKDFGTYIF